MLHINFLLPVLFLTVFHKCYTLCPPKDVFSGCTCQEANYDNNKIIVNCNEIRDVELLKKNVAALNTSASIVLRLDNFTLPHLPKLLFNGTNITSLVFLRGTFVGLSEKSRPYVFTGLEKSLKVLYFYKVNVTKEWDWMQIRVLRSLTSFLMQECEIHSTRSPSFRGLPLTRVAIAYTNMTNIGRWTFSMVNNLTSINLSGNKLTKFERANLPQSALQLRYLNLRRNEIFHLQEGVFQDLPALVFLSLAENQLMTLPELVFSPVWHHLSIFFVLGNPLECDSNMEWLLKATQENKKRTDLKQLVCSSPPKLKGRSFSDLYESDLTVDNSLD